MTQNEIQIERDLALSKVLLRRFRSHQDDIPLSELFEILKGEPMLQEARFNTYAAMASWVKKHPSLTVGMEPWTKTRSVCVLRMDASAAMYVGVKTGETLHVDFQALRGAPEFEPVGDTIFTTRFNDRGEACF